MKCQKNLEQIDQQWIQPLPLQQQLELIQTITQRLIQALPKEASSSPGVASISIMNLHGLGAEIWQEIDAQAYVNQLRGEWEQQDK